MASDPVVIGVHILAGIVASALALLVLATDPKRPANRRLGLVLGLETTLLLALILHLVVYGGGEDGFPRWLETILGGASVATSASYLVLLSSLDTPLARPFRGRRAHVALALYVAALAVGTYLYGSPAGDGEGGFGTSLVGILSLATVGGVAIFGIVVTVAAWRRTTPGTRARSQAGALLAAFVTRDVVWASIILFGVFAPEAVANAFWTIGPPLGTLLYVPILAYGLLREQLFDIDLKIKIGIQRSTVATIGLVAVLAAAKVAEFYLNRTFGFIAGGIAAGVLLVLAPRLNKLGDRMASAAMPKVHDTSAYVEFRKLEVYKAALESALEGGEVSEKERGTLDRLRAKLAILPADASRVEADVRESLAAA